MGVRNISSLLPVVAPLVLSQEIRTNNSVMLETTNGVRILQGGLFDGPDAVATTNPGVTINANAEDETIAAAELDPTISAPIYTPEECDSWISTLVSKDDDASNGLSESEYHSFLASIEEPPYISEYFQAFSGFDQLPWVFRVVHKSLACHCEKLGYGAECCEGDDAEVLLQGLGGSGISSTSRNVVEEEYKDLFCQQIAYVLAKSVPSPAPTDGPTFGPTQSPTASPTKGPTPSPSMGPSAGPSMGPSPSPATGSPTGSPTVGPTVTSSEPPTPSTVTATMEPTHVPSVSLVPSTSLPVPEVAMRTTESDGEEERGPNIGGIIGIILACVAILIAILALVAYRRRMNEQDELRKFAGEQAPEADLEAPPTAAEESEQAPVPEAAVEVEPPRQEPDEDDQSSAPSVWSESSDGEDSVGEMHDGHEEPSPTAGSALAAMGAASTVAARIGGNNSD